MNDDKGPLLLAKLAGVLALFGISTWSDAAAVISSLLGGSILTRFYWRNVWRPFLEGRGIIKRRPRRRTDSKDSDWSSL